LKKTTDLLLVNKRVNNNNNNNNVNNNDDDDDDDDNNHDNGMEDHILQMKDTIRGINGTAPMIMAQYSKVPDLDWILDAKCMDEERVNDVKLELEMEMEMGIDTDLNHPIECDDANCTSRVCIDDDHTIKNNNNNTKMTSMSSMEYCGPCTPQSQPTPRPTPKSSRRKPRTRTRTHMHARTHTHTSSITTMALIHYGSV